MTPLPENVSDLTTPEISTIDIRLCSWERAMRLAAERYGLEPPHELMQCIDDERREITDLLARRRAALLASMAGGGRRAR